MRSKKLILMVLLTVGVVFFLTSNVGAAPDWYFADVIMSGANSVPAVVIAIAHSTTGTPLFGETWCTLDASNYSNAKTMLAVVLTAMGLGRSIYVNMDAALPVPNIIALYIYQ